MCKKAYASITNPKYYREINESVCTDTVERINEILTHLNNIGFINEDQYTYLLALIPAEPRSFYLLPKVGYIKIRPNGPIPECRKADPSWQILAR